MGNEDQIYEVITGIKMEAQKLQQEWLKSIDAPVKELPGVIKNAASLEVLCSAPREYVPTIYKILNAGMNAKNDRKG